MRQAVVVAALAVVLSGLSGCSFTDPVKATIDDIIGQMNEASVKLNAVNVELKSVLEKAKKEGDRKIEIKDLQTDSIKTAFKELQEVGKVLVAKRDKAEQFKSKVDAERKKVLLQENLVNINSKREELDKSWKEYNDVRDKVLANSDADTRKYFTDDLVRPTMADFESIVRQGSKS